MKLTNAARYLLPLIAIAGMLSAGSSGADVLPPPVDEGQGVIFRASFDSTLQAEVAQGGALPVRSRGGVWPKEMTAKWVPGRFGMALTGPGAFDGYPALGNFLAERGTVAFHIRKTGAAYSFDPFTIRTMDPYYWTMYLRMIADAGGGFSVWFPNELYVPLVTAKTAGRPNEFTDNAWHHVAIVWDQAYGVQTYLDGRLWGSTWGKASWLSRGLDPDFIGLINGERVAYDELCIFDRPLSAEQVAALAATNTVPAASALPPAPFDDQRRANRLKEFGWERPDPGIPTAVLGRTGLGANAVRQIAPVEGLAIKKECNGVFDGKLGTSWPPTYNYRFNGGNGLHVRVDGEYDYMTLEGNFVGKVYGDRSLLMPTDRAPLLQLKSRSFVTRTALAAPRQGWLSFFTDKDVPSLNDVMPDEPTPSVRIEELGFFRRGTHSLTGTPERLYLGPAGTATGWESLGAQFNGRFGPGDRAAFSLAKAPPQNAGGQAVDALRFHHLIFPAPDKATLVQGMRLALRVRGGGAENLLRVEVRDPLLPARRTTMAEFALRGGSDEAQWLDVTVDFVDRMVYPGTRLWVTLAFKERVDVLWAGERESSFVELYTAPDGAVTPEYFEHEMAFVKSRFREMSEPRPWGVHKEPEKELADRNLGARELFRPLERLRELRPEDARVQAMWLWTHKFTVDTSPVTPKAVAGCPDAPQWALLQRELLTSCRDVYSWWMENRQAANGEFGDAWGDDTDLIQGVVKSALFADPDGRLARCARLVADGSYRDQMKRGINAVMMDPLHAYEEGLNAQAVAAQVAYGHPLYLERMMEASATVRDHLTAFDAKGRRRFRSNWFGATQMRDKGEYGVDVPSNALFMHPALILAYYCQSPDAVQLMREWVDGWIAAKSEGEASARPAGRSFPTAIRMDGTVERWDRRFRGYGLPGVFVGLYHLTRDPRYIDLSIWREGAGLPSNAEVLYGGLDRSQHHAALLAWAEGADLTRVAVDQFGHEARRRYLKYELTGDERPAIEALEASVRNIRTMFMGYTWCEPIDDRIWLPDDAGIVMAMGDLPHERNDLWPRHWVSYGGFGDFAAWLREKSEGRLKLWIYSFKDGPDPGVVRVWRSPAGTYRVRFGPADAQGNLAAGAGESSLFLHRAAAIPLRLPPRKLCVLEVELVKASAEDFYARPDLAVCADDAVRAGDKVKVVVHNLGVSAASNVVVRLADAAGKTLDEKVLPRVEPPVKFQPSRVEVELKAPAAGRVRVIVDPENRIAELNEENNAAEIN